MATRQSLVLDACRVDLAGRQVHREDETLSLSTHEARLLAYLAARPGQPIARDELYREVWTYASTVASRTLDVTVARLRQKIESLPGKPTHIVTVRGVGYRFEPTGTTQLQRSSDLPLLGRDGDLAALEQLLNRGVALLTILGPPGVGKSRLAEFLGARRKGLIVLHDPSSQLVQQRKSAATRGQVVATSLQPLRLRGEHRYGLHPLAQDSAIRLLEETLLEGGLRPVTADAPQLRSLASSLGGNPRLLRQVASDLAATARSTGLRAAIRALKVDRWLQDSVLDPKGGFAPHLEATWNDLEEDARELLAWAAGQPGGRFSLAEAEQPGGRIGWTVDRVQELLDASSLLREETAEGIRFAVPRAVGVYARARKAATTTEASHS